MTMANPDHAHVPFDPAHISRWAPPSYDRVAAALPLITGAMPILADFDLWDCWPLETVEGHVARRNNREYWFFLSAPRLPDPGQRHDQARIRLVAREGGDWIDLGNALPEGANPGSREWAGSAVLWDDDRLTLYFTAAGRAGDVPSFEQRLFEVDARLDDKGISGWGLPREVVVSDGLRYVAARELEGVPGAIKAFRDPAFFRDPATGHDHILFAGSAGWIDDPHNGVVGLATRVGDGWRLDDPLVEAVGINNELERPHIRCFGGHYYLFFSTQARTFSPTALAGPNGLYALVADQLEGPWRAVNGSGLVAANPAAEPTQAYSWWVDGNGEVIAFIDHWGLQGRGFDTNPELVRNQFGGTPAPLFALDFDGERVTIRR